MLLSFVDKQLNQISTRINLNDSQKFYVYILLKHFLATSNNILSECI